MTKHPQTPDLDPVAILASIDRTKLEAARVALQTEIAEFLREKRAEIAEFLRGKRGKLKALDVLLRAALLRDGVEPEKRKLRAKKPPPAVDLAGLIVRYLNQAGPQKVHLIAAAIAKTPTMVAETLQKNPARFFQVANGAGWGLVGVHDGKEGDWGLGRKAQ